MTPSERRAAMKEDMAKRIQESYDSKDSSGKFKSIFNKAALGSTPIWKCSEDEHFINIIPYIAGKKNPNIKEGKAGYNLDYYVHRKVGMNEDTYICLSRTFSLACPICEEQARLRKSDDFDEAFVKTLNPSRRVMYNIHCIDSEKEARKGIQIFEVSHWLFEKELAELAKKPRGGGFVLFQDPDEGKTVCFRKKGNGPTNTEYKGFQFEDRPEPIAEDILEAALCLDALIHIPTYDEVKKAFFGMPEDDDYEDDPEPPKRQEEPEPPKAKPFKCPGTRPDDFGELDECDDCPESEACHQEFCESEEEDGPTVAPEPEPEPPKQPATPRRAAVAKPEPTPEPVAETAPVARVRRRPGA